MKEYRGLAASAGIAVGPALLYLPDEAADLSPKPVSGPVDANYQAARLGEALAEAEKQLANIYEGAIADVGEDAAAVFLAHREFLSDPVLLEEMNRQIQGDRVLAEVAVETAFEGHAQQLEMLEDDYYRERALDLRDVSGRVRRILAGVQDSQMLTDLTSPVVIVARDLTPSDTAQMNKEMVVGFCTATGGLTSHTAIIARILGIPAVVGMGDGVLELVSGEALIVDGCKGVVIAGADEDITAAYSRQRDVQIHEQEREKAAARQPAITADGHRVKVVANIADAKSAELALDFGAEGVGLFRTECLYLNRQSMPSEEEQYQEYRAVADVLGDRPLIIRTLDIGGDKQLPYLDIGQEMNPFLGWRAIRLCLDDPELFEPQLRALLRASLDRNVQIMFPMVATLEEVRRAQEALHRVKAQLTEEGVPFDAETEVGIMIEVPSAAVMADVLALEVDFFSIGTNDLIQYTMACDRVNEKVAYLYDPLHPAVLRLIRNVIDAAHREEKWVGMCGEMAGDLEAIPLLLGMGLDEFSMNAPSIPAAKGLIRSLSMPEAQQIAERASAMKTAQEVREYLRSLDLACS
ncbi:MAG TPA: phosphoenolpyruvate--protein phosphotransferase [Anaerolineae bacterium]|nr:phosphoenolpyruvate--protein phosphotransferase [Anaerolineae bacterium]